jgi:hypothetical protein
MIFDIEKNDSTICCLPLQHTIKKVAGFLSRPINSKESENKLVTLTSISLLLDTSPESVSESLVSLMELGAIKLEHRRVVIRDPELLQNIAAHD